MDNLIKIGASVNIKRTDGKFHLSTVKFIIIFPKTVRIFHTVFIEHQEQINRTKFNI